MLLSCRLSGIKTEMTATGHVPIHKYTYPENADAYLFIDFQSAQVSNENQLREHVLDAEVNFENETTISGFYRTTVWLERIYYYVIEFNKPVVSKTLLPKIDEREKASRYVLDF